MPSVGNIVSPASNLFGSGSSKGASGGENQIANSQYDFMQTLQRDFGTTFAGQQNIINGLTKAAQNIIQAGPSQFGFSAPELTARNTLATTQNAVATRNAMTAAAQAAAAGSNGANLPAGAVGAREADIAQKSGEQLSNSLLGIQEAGYNAGRQNYYDAERTMEAAGQLENPTAYGSEANTAGENAFGSAKTIQQQNQAANPWTQVGGLVGSLAGTALSMVPGGQIPGAMLGSLSQKVGQSNKNFQSTYQPQSIPSDFNPQIEPMPMQNYNFDQSLYSPPYGGQTF